MEIYNTLFPNDGSSSGMVGVVARAIATSPPTESPPIPDSEASTSAAAMQALTSARTLEVVIAAFDDYCVPYKNLTMESFKFHIIVQAIMGENEEEHDEKLQLVLARAKENGPYALKVQNRRSHGDAHIPQKLRASNCSDAERELLTLDEL
ncbi:hypothetical protein ACLKA7_004982 [Drosophila subpalustris]